MTQKYAFQDLINLSDERIGAIALSCTDEFFAPKENLLKPGRGIFIPDKYTENGKWMDGWESRRKRVTGHDSCIIRLGLPGIIQGVDIDTNHFLGNHPPFASIEACQTNDTPQEKDWVEILAKVSLEPGSQNLFPVQSNKTWTHLRLNIYPDGGVARLRVYGTVVPDWNKISLSEKVDFLAVEHGGKAILCNDMFFSSKDNLIMPGRGKNMGDGWETKRKRNLPGSDWVILQLGKPSKETKIKIQEIQVDTHHFKGNFPDACSIDYIFSENNNPDEKSSWQELLPKTKLLAHHNHIFKSEILTHEKISHIKLNIIPDGGVSRLRLFGKIL